MPGDAWQRAANLRALLAWMWAHPGKKLLFMGGEFAQAREWNHDRSLDWHLLEDPVHQGLQRVVTELNRYYQQEPPLFESDSDPAGFQWIQADSAQANVLAFIRKSHGRDRYLVCVANLSPVPKSRYRIGMPRVEQYVEVLNTDAPPFGGSGMGNSSPVEVEARPWDEQPASAELTLPPLAVLWLMPIAQLT